MLIVQRHHAGWPQAHIAAAMGISRECVKTWLERYATEGEPGLRDRSSRPHTSPRQTSSELEQQTITLRQRERRGPAWLGHELGVPTRTVSRVLARHQIPRLAAPDPITGLVIRASMTTAVRYARDRPGELVHRDVTKIGRSPDGGGWRAPGRVHREATRPGFDPVDYRGRNVVERRFTLLKQWRGLATRVDKPAIAYRSAVLLHLW